MSSRRARDKYSDTSFSLSRHLLRTGAVAAGILALGLWLAAGASWWHWVALPGFWLVANVFEWTIHRYFMHRPAQPRVLYRNHALIHHNAFSGRDQEIASVTELSMVMMPWYTLLLLFAMASPITVAAALVGGRPLAGVFVIAAVAYFLLYELIHTLHHLPSAVLQRTSLARSKALTTLRAHHHHHHQLERMTRINFNVTFPIADRLLRTYERPPS